MYVIYENPHTEVAARSGKFTHPFSHTVGVGGVAVVFYPTIRPCLNINI